MSEDDGDRSGGPVSRISVSLPPDLLAELDRMVESRGYSSRSQAIGEMVKLWGSLDALERDHKLDFLRQPDLGFAWVAYRWAEGDALDDVLVASDLAAGDFVRWMKQLLDLGGQVADAAGGTPLRETAREMIRAMRRGVVAYSSLADDE